MPVRAILGVLLLASASIALAENGVDDSGRLLSRIEGKALAERILGYPTSTPWPDCSHLVHEVLNDAGLEYPYATSNELYAGVPHFRRVRRGQAGDLVVWRGHVGVVVDSQNHRFFSSTESGPRTDDYQNDYWRGRGIPHFYRYVVTDQTQLMTRAQRGPSSKRIVKPADTNDEDESSGQKTIQPAEAVVVYRVPESLPIEPSAHKLSKADIDRALAGYLQASIAAFEKKQSIDEAIVVVRRAQVRKIHLEKNFGWAEIRFDSRAYLAQDGTWNKIKAEKVRWSLRHNEDGWQLLLPSDRIYVSQAAAARSSSH
jgi:hypothetical protein